MGKLYLQHDYRVTGRDYVETDGGVDYSLEERKIGKWYDGSDLYECCYSTEWSVAASTSESKNQTLELNVPDVKDLIYYEMIPITRSSAYSAVQGNATRSSVFALTVAGDITVSSGKVNFHTVTANANLTWTGFSDVIVKIRYTKTE